MTDPLWYTAPFKSFALMGTKLRDRSNDGVSGVQSMVISSWKMIMIVQGGRMHTLLLPLKVSYDVHE